MHPILVVDGPDGGGKTTLSGEIARLSGAKERHLTYRFKDRMHQYHTAALEMCLKDAEVQPVVLDRWWASEKIYADVFRGGSKWPLMGRMLDRVALKHGFLYVICLPYDKEKYLAHFNKLKEERVEMFDNMSKVYDEYAKLWERFKYRPDFRRYDWMEEGQDLSYVAEQVYRQACDQQIEYNNDHNDRRWAGQFVLPDVVFVGDQSKPKGRHKVWPFFEYANSSLWLAETLEKIGLGEERLGWANLFGPDGKVQWTKHAFEYGFGKPKIIALGNNARNGLRALGVQEDGFLPHPQWCRRFAPVVSVLTYERTLKELGVI